jgi:hypothetical protein
MHSAAQLHLDLARGHPYWSWPKAMPTPIRPGPPAKSFPAHARERRADRTEAKHLTACACQGTAPLQCHHHPHVHAPAGILIPLRPDIFSLRFASRRVPPPLAPPLALLLVPLLQPMKSHLKNHRATDRSCHPRLRRVDPCPRAMPCRAVVQSTAPSLISTPRPPR